MKESLSVLLTGFMTVFIGLLCLIGIIYAMSFIVRIVRREERAPKRKKEKVVLPEPQAFVPPVSGAALPQLSGPDRREVIAAVSAAIAETLGTDISGIRIRSIRRVGGEAELASAERRELVAVISAAVAEEMGTEVSAIRIHSIRKTA